MVTQRYNFLLYDYNKVIDDDDEADDFDVVQDPAYSVPGNLVQM